jgi:thiamine-phosphate pyrophosphorylase
MLPPRGLYAITDGPRADLIDVCAAATAGGAAMLQYRDKTRDNVRRREEAGALATLCARNGIPLIINDDIELAAEVGAAGVHLGEDDADIASARARLGPRAIVGVSCYDSIERARELAAAGADYLAFGAFFASPTKPNARVATLQLLQDAKVLNRPLVAIGGITAANGAALIDAGADFLAVISGVFGAPDVREAALGISALFVPARS